MKTLLLLLLPALVLADVSSVQVRDTQNKKVYVMPVPVGGKIPCATWTTCSNTSPTTTPPTTPTTTIISPPTTSGDLVAPTYVSNPPAYLAASIGVQQISGTTTNPERTTTAFINGTGQFRTGFQGEPMVRGMPVQLGQRLQPGGWPNCNGDSYQVIACSNPCKLGLETSVNMPWVRHPWSTVRTNQLIYPGYAGTDAIGHFYRAISACKTGRTWTITWPTTAGATVSDGSCVFREIGSFPVTFVDGTATLGLTYGADAYCGKGGARLGSNSPNEPFFEVMAGDNNGNHIATAYPNMGGPPNFASMEMPHTIDNGGDVRRGTAANFHHVSWNPWIYELGGSAGAGRGAAEINEPWLPPIVTLVPGTSRLTLGKKYCFAHEWEDERWQNTTKPSIQAECVTVTSATNQCIEVTIPFSEWPSASDNVSGQQGVRAWVYQGDRTHYCVYVGSIEKPAGVAGPGNDRLRICSDDEMFELHTCEAYNRNTRAVVAMGDSYIMPRQWRSNLSVRNGQTMVCPTIQNGHCFIAEGVQCNIDCSVCQRGYSRTVLTGLEEPDWSKPFQLACGKDGIAWKRLGLIGHSLMTSSGPVRWINETRPGLPIVAAQAGMIGGQFTFDILNQDCANPLDYVSCPPLRRIMKDGDMYGQESLYDRVRRWVGL